MEGPRTYEIVTRAASAEVKARRNLELQEDFTASVSALALENQEVSAELQVQGTGIVGARLVWSSGEYFMLNHKLYKRLFKDKMLAVRGLTQKHRQTKFWNTKEELPWVPVPSHIVLRVVKDNEHA